MSDELEQGLSDEELDAQGATALPDKEVVSILDLNADIDLAIDAAAPIDLAVAANANVAAPIDAAVGANVLSFDSTAQALSDQGVIINQGIDADATADAVQDSALDQGNDVVDDGTAEGAADRGRRRCSHARHRRAGTGVVDGTTGAVGDAAPATVGDDRRVGRSGTPPAVWSTAVGGAGGR